MLDKFEKGSGGRYVYDEETKKLVRISFETTDPNKGLNGPVWFPKGGYKYFDKALNKTFNSLSEKKAYMRENKLAMRGDEREYSGVDAKGVGSTLYFYNK